MQKRNLIPTPLIQPAEVAPITIAPLQDAGRFETIRLVFNLIGFLVGLGWASAVRHRPPAEIARRTRVFLEDLGGLWIKAGQILSLRTDLLPPEMVEELSNLQYHARGFEPEIARQIVTTSLGQPIEAVFAVFEDLPFAAASISQVHRGRLRRNGQWVAVKVQRPGITRIFARDLRLITWLLRQLGRVPSVAYIPWDGMIRELQRIMQEEIDYRYEVANLRRLRKVLKRHKVYVPRVYTRVSGKQIIVMEFITGVLLSDYLRVQRNDPARANAWRAANNIDPHKVGSRLLRSFYRQLLEDNLFHGDLHPGNIVLFKDSRFALIDLGTIGNLEARFVELYKLEAFAVAERDYSKAADYFLLLADSIPAVDITAFKTETVEYYRAWEARTHQRGLSYAEKSITGGVAVQVAAVARKYKVSPTWQLLRVTRSLATLDSGLNALLDDVNPNKILRKYFRQAQGRTLDRVRRQGIGRLVGGAVSELQLAGGLTTARLRQDAIRFQDAQTKVDHFVETLLGIVRLALFVGAVALGYSFLYRSYTTEISGLHTRLGAFGQIAEGIARSPVEWHIVALIGVVYLVLVVHRLKQQFAKGTVRLPNGRLDT
jgi:ubiquinone biosynthesis protein